MTGHQTAAAFVYGELMAYDALPLAKIMDEASCRDDAADAFMASPERVCMEFPKAPGIGQGIPAADSAGFHFYKDLVGFDIRELDGPILQFPLSEVP